MLDTILTLSLVWLFVLLGVVMVALLRARQVPRRLVLNDTAVQVAVIALALLAILRGEPYFLDAALALALLSFVSSIVVAAYALRHRHDVEWQ